MEINWAGPDIGGLWLHQAAFFRPCWKFAGSWKGERVFRESGKLGGERCFIVCKKFPWPTFRNMEWFWESFSELESLEYHADHVYVLLRHSYFAFMSRDCPGTPLYMCIFLLIVATPCRLAWVYDICMIQTYTGELIVFVLIIIFTSCLVYIRESIHIVGGIIIVMVEWLEKEARYIKGCQEVD